MNIATVGLDVAKYWFQVRGVEAHGQTVVRLKLCRSEVIAYFKSLEPCLVGMEARATAHHGARELTLLGYEVKLMPPGYVKGYVKRNQNDTADAEAICEAVTRPMRFVPVKTVGQQAVLMLRKYRDTVCAVRYGWEPDCEGARRNAHNVMGCSANRLSGNALRSR